MSQKEQLAKLAEKAGIAGYCNIPALMEYMEAAFLLGARARDRQLLDEFRFHLPFDAAKIEGIMRVTKPEDLL